MRLADAHPGKIDHLVDAMVQAARAGDVQAAVWVRDTLDGKPATQIVGDNESDPVRLIITGVPRAVNDESDMDATQP